jgi:hypothetical protein
MQLRTVKLLKLERCTQLEVAKLLKFRDVYGARSEEASEKETCMKLIKYKASEAERALGAVQKRFEAKKKKNG